MATNLYNLFKPLTFLVSNAHFWLWHRCFLRVSPKPSSFGCIFPLWHRCFPLDFTGALFFVPSWDSAFFAPCLDFVGTCGPLHVFAKTWCLTSLLVVADITSLTPLFSWLKGVPPGINPSSRQQKKRLPHALLCKTGWAMQQWEHPGDLSGDTSRCKWACHQFQRNGLACSRLLNPPDVVHHRGCRLARLRWRSSYLGCLWTRKPFVHPLLQR